MTNVFLNLDKECCGCTHNIFLYIIVACVICVIVLLVLIYMYMYQRLRHKHEQSLLQCCKNKEICPSCKKREGDSQP